MAYENSAGINVHNHYGPRDTGGTVGVEHSQDSIHQLSIYLTPNSLNETFVSPTVIPAGARFIEGFITVEEALAGATAVLVGEDGAESTNGVDISTLFGTTGTKAIGALDATGTWAFDSAGGTTSAEAVGVAVTGTATAGKATVTLKYYYKDRT